MQEKKKEIEILDSKEQPNNIPSDVRLHENGVWYKEIPMGALEEPFKLFNTLKPARLEGETYNEYKIRRMLNNSNEKKTLFHDSKKLGTYIKNKT